MNEPQTDTPRTDHIESALGTASQQCHPTIWMHARQLERENAALRADKERLDFMDHNAVPWAWRPTDGSPPLVYCLKSANSIRATIDAKRKEVHRE